MNRIISRFVLLVCAILMNSMVFAQNQPQAKGVMLSNGKIYVVVASCLTILIGLFIYVFIVDRKVSRIEKNG